MEKPIDLLIRTNKVFSFGVNEDDSHKNALYSLPLCLYTRNDTKDEEKEWVSKFGEIIEKCNRKVKKSLGKLGKVEALHWKEDDQDAGPIVYAKIPYYKGKFRSKFYNDYEEPNESLEYDEVDPKDLIEQLCKLEAILKIDSITITDKVRLKVELVCARVTELIRREGENYTDFGWPNEDDESDDD